MHSSYPLRHLSIRVPWHDAGWTGTVCQAPQLNGACAKLKAIANSKKDEKEIPVAGCSLEELPKENWPCCVEERAMFMAPFEIEIRKTHALAGIDPNIYGHFLPTPQRYPPYSAGVVPFFWVMHGNMENFSNLFELDVDQDREPALTYETTWIHEGQNQLALLDAFAGHLRPEDSLCLFYAKHVPFVEGTGRILIGAGRVKNIGPLTEYQTSKPGMRGMIWERPVQHSIRPQGRDGFLMPYHQMLAQAEQDPTLDCSRYTAKVQSEHWSEFSYASELVTHDGAIAALLSMDVALDRAETELGIPTGWQRRWVHDELVRLWKVRGPFPGLGAVLAAFGLSRGIFVAHALQQQAGENADPWPLVDKAFIDVQSVLPRELHRDFKELAPIWKNLPPERRQFLRLLSRFELTVDQAKMLYEEGSRKKDGLEATDKEILHNPYLLYECSRHDPEGIRLLTIDRGVFPEDTVRLRHPLEPPSGLDSAVDPRRLRAFTIAALEEAATAGNTLMPHSQIVDAITSLPVRPPCPITGDILAARLADMAPEVVATAIEDDSAVQLERYQTIAALAHKQINGRLAGKRLVVDADWPALVDLKFKEAAQDPEEKRARAEKAAALKELAEARFSVLAGPAGAGKTTVLSILCDRPEVHEAGVLMLAPTGKARVRMQELAGRQAAMALTIAQFLNQYGRYNGRSGRYEMTNGPKASGFGTVIVDESSMLTEDMLGALFDALQGVNRLILVGDPAQLPPIGAGRPFVDIVTTLRPANNESRFPRVAPGYAELTIERRQQGNQRADLRLARWFSASPPSVGDDDVFFTEEDAHRTIRFVEWKKPEDFQEKLIEVLQEELQLDSSKDEKGFNRQLGAVSKGEYDYFNATRNGVDGAVQAIEKWQILSPLRGMPFGVNDINRQIHECFRASLLQFASGRSRSIPKPYGSERIVYGDKVINLKNHKRDGKRVYPREGALGYLANGEIGIAVGQWKTRGNPTILKVEFSSQQGFTYDFHGADFKEEGDPLLELAYALTVHKAQGSQFALVLLVLPEGHPILSRELIYTALTRHQDRVVVLHQGPRTLLKDFTAPYRSETARRMTNLLQPCKMIEFPLAKGSVFLQEGLTHRTSTGIAVRSKSELVIFEALRHAGYQPVYEQALTLGGQTRYPDFTIEDDISGQNIYWEHLGLLEREDYRRSWQAKLSWYRENGVLPAEEGGGSRGMLITSTESSTDGFDVAGVHHLIHTHLHG